MSCPFNQESLSQLKFFVDLCKTKPSLLNSPELNFFKDFIESLGGKIPESKPMPKPDEPTECAPPEEEVDSDPESVLEFDMEGCVEPDEISDSQVMGDDEKQPTEDEMDNASKIRREGMNEYSEGNYEAAVKKFTEAILVNPQSAILYTKRGQSFIKLNKPNACIKDCSHALELNCDSAPAYKYRGRAYQLVGDWENSAKDLRMACKLDMDDQINEWLKEVQPNALKIEQHNLKKQRKQLEREEKEKLERIRKAREAHAKAAESNAEPSAGESGASSQPGMGDFYKLMQDPEIIKAFQDPEVAAAFQDISTNPANIMKYQTNPKVQALIKKLSSKFSGGGGMFPGFGGFPGAGGGFPGAAGFPGFPGAGATTPQDDGLD